MQRRSKTLWQIVSPTVRTKVARHWLNRESTTAYLQELYERTLVKRANLQRAAEAADNAQWGDPRTAADVDLARVYAVAAQCVKFDTYKEFAAAMNSVTVRQVASQLTGSPPWTPADLYQAQRLVLRS